MAAVTINRPIVVIKFGYMLENPSIFNYSFRLYGVVKMLKCGLSAGKVVMDIIKKTKIQDAYYIVGFVDGEGSFNVSFKDNPDYKYKIKISASFNISQKELKILAWIKSKLGCGTIRSRSDGLFYFEVTNLDSLNDIVIPFFDRYRLRTRKHYAFTIFKMIVNLMLQGEHKTKEGMIQIFQLRDKIEVGRKRKHNVEDIIKIFDNVS